ncbi:hypothetical protein HF521_003349 [Silurus meridionalis]|uniref:Uncharacterized protein n=1 Tax=Silurus meridionalis TaxID=175797 RepID=A0A8T0B3V4_SILME|nr:hypothetical protein HF521_003349 [Silurus meridionalis]
MTVKSLDTEKADDEGRNSKNRVMIRHFPNYGHVGEGSRKRKYKSPRDNHGNKSKSMARIYQLMFSPRGPFMNTPKRLQDDLEDETPVSVTPAKTTRINSSNVKHPAIVSGVSGDTSETVTNQPMSSVRTEHRKCKYKSPRHGDNDDNNFETMAQIRQQMYGPGGPYYNMAHCKQPHDDLEDKDESPVSQPPEKTTRTDTSYIKNPSVFKFFVDTSEPKPSINQLKSILTKFSCTEQRKSPCDADDASTVHITLIMNGLKLNGLCDSMANREPSQDDLDHKGESPVNQPPAKTVMIDSSHVDYPLVSGVSGDTSETVTNQPKPSVRTEHHKCEHKSPCHGENGDNNFETMAQIRQQMYGPGGPFYNMAHRKRPQDDLEDKEESSVSQSPAKTTRTDSLYSKNPAILTFFGDTSEPKPSTSQLKSSFTKFSCNEQRKSPCDADDTSNVHKTTIMIHQILNGLYYTVANQERLQDDLQDKDESPFGPEGRYYNMAHHKRPQYDLEGKDESPVNQPPAKTVMIDSSYVKHSLMSGVIGDTSETVTNQPMSSVRTEHRKCKYKSPRHGDNDDNNFETMAQIRQQMYGPGGPYYNVAHHKRPHDDLEDKVESPVSQPPAKIRSDSSYVENPAVSKLTVDTSEPKPSNSQLKSGVTEVPCTEQRKSPCDADDASNIHKTTIMIRQILNGLNYTVANRERPQDDLQDQDESSFGPGGRYYNMANDHKDESPVSQPPAKTVMIDSSHVDHPLVSEVSDDTSETVTKQPKPSVQSTINVSTSLLVMVKTATTTSKPWQ